MNKLACVVLFSMLTVSAVAEPTGGEVRAGSATIQGNTIHQLTNKAIIDWQRFNVDANELVKFIQPNQSAVLLNRVVGSDPSRILGRLQANGQLFLVNPNGILFGPNSRVDVGSLMATTLSISNQDFLSGNYSFQQDPGFNPASVVNQGEIQVSDEGYVILSAPLVNNEGLIVANLGKVTLAAGTVTTVALDGRHLVSYQVQGPESATAVQAGTIRAGNVDLESSGATTLTEGSLTHGGDLRVLGSNVTVSGTVESENGTLLVGGNLRGEGPEQNSKTTKVDGSISGADTIVVWSDERTDVSGTLQAANFIETSSHQDLQVTGSVNAGGEWLLDPADIAIVNGAGSTNNISVGLINTALSGGTSVTINAGVPSSTVGTVSDTFSGGSITMAAGVNILMSTSNTDATLTLTAGNGSNITLDGNITRDASGTGALNVILGGIGTIVTLNGNIDLDGSGTDGNFSNSGPAGINQTGTVDLGSGNLSLNAGFGPISLANVTAGNVTVISSQNITLGSVTATGTATITAGGSMNELGSDGAADITAPNVALQAASGIGSTGTIEIDADTLAARITPSGILSLEDLDDLNIGTVGSLTGLNIAGAITLTTHGTLTGSAIAGSAGVNITNTDGATTLSNVSSSFGSVSITRSGLTNTTGAMTLTNLDANTDINILRDAPAHSPANFINTITLTDLSAAGNISIVQQNINTVDEILVDSVVATGNVSLSGQNTWLHSPPGFTPPAIVGQTVTLHSPYYLDVTIDATNAVVTSNNHQIFVTDTGGGLNVTATTNNSDISITSQGGGTLQVNNVSGGGGIVTLSSAGGITQDGDAAADVTASTLNATAATGISLDTTIGTLNASVSGAGSLSINETNGLIIGANDVSTANGSVNLTTNGDLTSVAGSGIGSSNNISLTVHGGIISLLGQVACMQNLTITHDTPTAADMTLALTSSDTLNITRTATSGTSALNLTTITTNGNMVITKTGGTGGDISVGQATSQSGGTITVNNASGAINELGPDLGTEFSAPNVLLTASGGIGTTSTPGLFASNLSATVTGAGPINLADDLGVAIDTASTVNGPINISSDSFIDVGTITAQGTNSVTLSAPNNEIMALPGSLVTADSLTMTAKYGIGTLNLAVNSVSASNTTPATISLQNTGNLNATVTTNGGDLQIQVANGDLTATNIQAGGPGTSIQLTTTGVGSDILVNSVIAPVGITLNASGQILEAVDDPGADLSSATMTLTAVSGIGFGNNLEINATGPITANVTGIGPLALSDVAGGLEVTSATTADGLVRLIASNGDLIVHSAFAGGTARNATLNTFGTGNVRVGSVHADDGTISMTTSGRVIDHDGDVAVDLTAKRIYASTATGVGPLDIDTPTVTNVAVSGTGDITLRDVSGGLSVTRADTNDGAVSITAENGPLSLGDVIVRGTGKNLTASNTGSGDLQVGNVSAAGDAIFLTSAGKVLELGGDPEADLTATDLNVTSQGLGDTGATIETQIVRLSAAVTGTGRIILLEKDSLQVPSATTANGSINLRSTGAFTATSIVAGGSGNVTLATVGVGSIFADSVTAGGTLTATAFSAINESGADTTPDLTAPTVALSAGTGIGTTARLELDTDSLSAVVTGAGKIDLEDTSGSGTLLTVTNASTANGDITLAARGGGIRADNLNAGGNVSLTTVTTGNLQIDQVSATGSVTLDAAQNVLEVGSDPDTDVTAGASSTIRARLGTIATADGLEVTITAGTLSVEATQQSSGLSIRLFGTVNGSPSPTGNLIHLNTPPGLSRFNGTIF